MGIRDRLQHAWNAFSNNKPEDAMAEYRQGYGSGSFGLRPDRFRVSSSNERSIIASIYTRLGVDIASVFMRHIRKDDNDRYLATIKSGLHDCLNVEANLDQAASSFRQDLVMSLFDKGVVAIVPIDTTANPDNTGSYDIRSLRVGYVVTWFPSHVRVSVYNERTGKREELLVRKQLVAIVENPLYSVMNEPNSILQRIIRKLQLLDAVDEAAGSGKLDIIIQLPYTIKSDIKRQQAENRREMMETQLAGSKYGIAYTDATEKITQLNRPAENNMLKQIEYLMGQLYGQLGLDETIFKGTANEATMLNYQNRTVKPVLRAFTEAMTRTFLTKTARAQGQLIDFQMDMFALVPISQLAEIGDKLLRNEVITSNEMRQILGFRPADDPKADQLVNANMPGDSSASYSTDQSAAQDALVEETLANLEATADEIVNSAGG